MGTKRNGDNGYVYLILAETGHYKIGRTCNVPNRMKLFAVKLPFDFTLVHYFSCDDAVFIEKMFHQIFDDDRVRGEWFDLKSESVQLIKKIDSMTRALPHRRNEKGDLILAQGIGTDGEFEISIG